MLAPWPGVGHPSQAQVVARPSRGALATADALAASRPAAVSSPRPGPDHVVASGADADQRDRHADELGDELQVLARGGGQVGLRPALADVLGPALQLLVLADGVVEHRLVVREVVELGSLGAAVARADVQPVEAREHVELRDRERGQRVEPDRVAERDQVEPADAPRAARGGPVLAAALADRVAELVLDLGRERPGADAGHVRLRDAPDLVDVLRPDAGADARGARDRVRRGDERIRAVVDVEQRALRALEQDRLAGCRGARARAWSCRRSAARAGGRRRGTPRSSSGGRAGGPWRTAAATAAWARARRRSSSSGSSRRAGPGRGFRAAPPCRRSTGRSRAGWSRSGACRASPRRRGRAAGGRA